MRLPPRARRIRDAIQSAEAHGWWAGYSEAMKEQLAARIVDGPIAPTEEISSVRRRGRYVARRTPTGHILRLVSP